MNFNVTRKAILIGCPGSGSNYLHGVESDLSNVQNFLYSDKGGRWFNNEIKTLANPNFQELVSTIQSTIADYVFIYFSGHGWTSELNERMLSLRGSSISDLKLLNQSPKQLIIVDACRKYVSPGISGIPDFGEGYDNFDGYYEARELFNSYILNSPCGRMIVHATQINEYSYDSPKGGYFTQALLQVSTRIKSADTYTAVFLPNILTHVPSILRKQNNFQVPVIYSSGNLIVPFAIGIPKEISRPIWSVPKNEAVQPTADFSSNELAWGLGILFLIAALGGSK